MASETGGRSYSLTELFAIKFVLGDVLVIAAFVLAGPVYGVVTLALLVLSFILVWYLTRSEETDDVQARSAETDADRTATESASADDDDRDPVTRLQERYAAGELSDAEFEAKLERLIDSNERADRAGIDTEDLEFGSGSDSGPEPELERSD
ncbi:SHOCT domain-containing protein [Halopiger aswanensis]|uniref:Putative oligomerization/nucleic acid binding protein n=1 Tax=Halopiger aswanensis TaxID=148449 RepID=A0A3R7HYZ5_9EURY|nr:SHOCT domain-containing protein [Halopiger aswanensis]RKD97177.1 putative oligomerization/nucleic acid binding protein [Halopiger aswanensis]